MTTIIERNMGHDPAEERGGRRRVLLTTVASDAHTWNLMFLQMLLDENGFDVVNLGPCTPVELAVRTAGEQDVDAIVVSSVNGHGQLDGMKLIAALRADERTRALPVLIGGKLGIDGESDRHTRALLDAGFDAVFADTSDPATLIEHLDQVTAGANPLPAGIGGK